MTVVHLLSKDDFETVAKNSKLVLVHFFAEWVEQCGHINDILDEMVKQTDFKDVRFTKILAEQVPEVSLSYKVSAVPTLVILRNGMEVDRIQGSDPNQLVSKLRSHMTISKESSPPLKVRAPVDQHPHEGGDLNERLKSLVRAAPVMLFMKGNANQPRCGFSRQILEVLNNHNANYKTFDILNDNDVREGLKKFSNWPTYPQLYIDGELIGGLDIVKELVASGEFQAMLPNSASQEASLDDRLRRLTNKSKIMVFMKGNAQNPKCGFSRQLIEILNEASVKYETFDILEDEEIRQGLKKYSNWPTYPQLYVGGELVGGLDIVKEQKQSGELAQILTA